MCEQRVALDFIKKQKNVGGLSANALFLHEKQCEDWEKMEKRMSNLEEKLDTLEQKFDTLENKITLVLDTVNKRQSPVGSLKEILSNKVFLYLLITLLTAAFGVSVGEVGTFLFK